MKLSLALSVGCAAVAAASSSQGAIFVPAGSMGDSGAAPTTLSTSDARLLIAQRLGLSSFHSLRDASDSAIELLARASSSQQPLFAPEAETPTRRTLLIIDGESEERLEDFYSGWDRVASLSESPSKEKNIKFVSDLLSLDGQRRWKSDKPPGFEFEWPPASGCITGASNKDDMGSWTHEDFTDVYHIDLGQNQASMARDIEVTLYSFDGRKEVTLLVLPKSSRSNVRSGDWGSHNLGKRSKSSNKEDEEIISAPMRPAVSGSSSKKLPSSSNSHSKVLATATGHPNATMGFCASSQDLCEARTNNCSGHGSCRQTVKNSRSPCWKCSCKPTTEDGTTQYWGGAACQKQDISVQFWLFAGFSVAATALVTWGIGLLYSMGEADLPSVLSAGVAPTTRK